MRRIWHPNWVCFAIFVSASGCSIAPKPGVSDLPPLPKFEPGIYTDINPRWSNDGLRIAFLRSTPDQRLQLHLTNGDLDQTNALLESELVSPDRLYDPKASRYSSPDTIAWSADDKHIAFERAEWFQFDDGQRLPGTAIWSIELRTGRIAALALHPKRYTNLYYYYHTPAWSPDGKYLSFVAEGINGQHLLGIRCINVENPKEVSLRFDNYAATDWPVWRRPTGATFGIAPGEKEKPVLTYCRRIFRSSTIRATAAIQSIKLGAANDFGSGELWRMRPSEFEKAEIDSRRGERGDVIEPRIGSPVWSPDGKKIAFTLTASPNDISRSEIWLLSQESERAHRISPVRGGFFAPVWIDNGQLGALTPVKDKFEIVTIATKSESRKHIGTIGSADCDWSPDRSRIVYAQHPSSKVNSPDEPTTLRILETGIGIPSTH